MARASSVEYNEMHDMTQNKDKGHNKGVKNIILICKQSTPVGIIF